MQEPSLIAAQGLTRRYGKKQALDRVDLILERGSGITAILGQNGAGKTTFVHCALGLVRPSTGHLRVFGGKPGAMASRQRIGAMLQDADLPALLTPREHIRLFASYYPKSYNVDELIELCDISDFAHKVYKNLSGGQKRRVQFALALVGKPDLVFLDEPTTGLDLEARRILWGTIQMLTEQGASVILTTHYLEEADALAERIIVFGEGRVIADAPTDDIRNRVGGGLIQCITALTEEHLQALPGVRSVERRGRYMVLSSATPVETLRQMLGLDETISELTVSKPTLEDAFIDLTRIGGQS